MKEESFQNKIQRLQPWFDRLVEEIKKDVKTDLRRQFPKVYQKHFSRMHFVKCRPQELAAPLLQEVLEGDEQLGEWLATRWIVKNDKMFQFFADHLMQVNPEFDKIERLSDEQGSALMQAAIGRYGAQKTFLFSVLNSVAFSPEQFEQLAALAREESHG